MYCPNCGIKTSDDKRFCRLCGFGLERVLQIYTAELSAQEGETAIDRRRQMLVERLASAGRVFFGIGGLGLLAFVFYGIISIFIIEREMALFGAVLLFFVIGMILLLSREYLQQAMKDTARTKKQPAALPDSAGYERRLAESKAGMVTSVTEHTTELFEPAEPDSSEDKHRAGQRAESQ